MIVFIMLLFIAFLLACIGNELARIRNAIERHFNSTQKTKQEAK